MGTGRFWALAMVFSAGFWMPPQARAQADNAEIEALQQEIEAMQEQLDNMNARLRELRDSSADAEASDTSASTGTSKTDDDPDNFAATRAETPTTDAPDTTGPDRAETAPGDVPQIAADTAPVESAPPSVEPFVESLDQRLSHLEDLAEDWLSEIRFGGALRLNYAWRDYDELNKDRLGDFDLELVRLNTDGQIGDVSLSAEWRRYNNFQAIHHAWLGYDFNEQLHMQLGINQVPFGILPFASHSFWFGGTYYLGFEDDYDSGIKFIHEPNDDWTFHYAFYKNPEYADGSRLARYSFDLVTGEGQQNTEINQFNLRAERHFRLSEVSTIDAGLSLQRGEIYNTLTQRTGDQFAFAGHINANLGPWNIQLQGIRYQTDPENPPGVADNFLQAGAFEAPFLMPADANVYSINLARNLRFPAIGPLESLSCYNDLTLIEPRVPGSDDSIQNVTGCSVSAGGAFIYFDWIAGKNMWFVGGEGIGLDTPTSDQWSSRLNINVGYYF